MHHLYPSVKGDPLCPLGFHPQVRWPTRCKRCFRDYKEHGGKRGAGASDAQTVQLRREGITTASSPNIGPAASPRTTSDVSGRNWTSTVNLSASATIDQGKAGCSSGGGPASWISTPDLSHLEDDTQASGHVPTVSLTLPMKKRKVAVEATEPKTTVVKKPGGGAGSYNYRRAASSYDFDTMDVHDKIDSPKRLQIKEVKSVDEPTTNDVQFLIQVKTKTPQKDVKKRMDSLVDLMDDSDSVSTAGTDDTLVGSNRTDYYAAITKDKENLKKDLQAAQIKIERLEKEKSGILLRRLTAMDTSKGNTSEVLKLQQRCNELQTQMEDYRDGKKELAIRVKELEKDLENRPVPPAAQKLEDELRSKLLAAELLCEELMDENEDVKKELRETVEEMDEMQDTFREDQADEYTTLKKELEQTTKNCRILSFKLRKTERKLEQIETEKVQVENKLKDVAGIQNASQFSEKIKQLEKDLTASVELSKILQKKLEDSGGVKKAPLLGALDKTHHNKISRESLTRGGSQDDPSQVTRDLQDSLEREADLREQLKFAEEEGQTLRKKAARIEEENESLVLQLKKMATRTTRIGVGRKSSPTPGALNAIDEKMSNHNLGDLSNVTELKLQLELSEQETAVLRKKLDDLEVDNENMKKKNKELLTRAPKTTASKQDTELKQKIDKLQDELKEAQQKINERDRDVRRLESEISLNRRRSSDASLNKPQDMDQRTLNLKQQVDSIEKETEVLRSKVQSLESENEKLMTENKRLQLVRGAKNLKNSDKTIVVNNQLIDQVATLEVELAQANEKVASLENRAKSLKSAETELEILTAIKLIKTRKPKMPTELSTKLQLKNMVLDLEREFSDLVKKYEKAETGQKSTISKPNGEVSTGKALTEIKAELDQSKKKYDELNKKYNDLEDAKKKTSADFEELQANLKISKDEGKNAHAEISRLKDISESLDIQKKLVETKEKEIRRLMIELENKDKSMKEISSSAGSVSSLRSQLSDSSQKVKDLEKAMKDVEKQLKEEKTVTKTKERDIVVLKGNCDEFGNRISELNVNVKKHLQEISAKSAAIKTLEESLETERKKSGASEESVSLKLEIKELKVKLGEAENNHSTVEKNKKTLEEKVKKLDADIKAEKEKADKLLSAKETDIQNEKKKAQLLKTNHERETKNKEIELAALRSKIKTMDSGSSTSQKLSEVKAGYEEKIKSMEDDIKKTTKEYENLTAKYEVLEEEHVVTKAQMVSEKESLNSQLVLTKKSLDRLEDDSEDYTKKERMYKKQISELKELLEKRESASESTNLERTNLKTILKERQQEVDQVRREYAVIHDQLEYIRKENDDLKKKLDDYDKVSKIQRNISADSSAMENEMKQLRSKVMLLEKNKKTDISECKIRYEGQVSVLNEELRSLHNQVIRFKREKDTYKHMLEGAQKMIGDLKSNKISGREQKQSIPNYDELEEGKTKIATLEQQVSCMEDELSEARLESSKLKTELISERSSLEIKTSELQSRINEMEEEKILSSGRTKIVGLRTRMELSWQKEREEQQRLLQETATLARDLRQTLFEVERERDKEKLEGRRKTDQIKKTLDEEQDESRRKITELQCDLLELRDAHAKLRTTNEKLRREKERNEREREEMKFLVNGKRRTVQEDDRRLGGIVHQVEQLVQLAPELFGRDRSSAPYTPTPPKRTKSKSRESSPGLGMGGSRESLLLRDDRRTQVQTTFQKLADLADELKRAQIDEGSGPGSGRRDQRYASFQRSTSTENDGVPTRAGGSSAYQRNALHRKSISLEQSKFLQDNIPWVDGSGAGSDLSLDMSQSDIEAMQRRSASRSRRDASLDSRLSADSTQSDVAGDKGKKKKSLMGKLKKLTKSRSIDDQDPGTFTPMRQLSSKNNSASSDINEDPKGSKKDLKGRITDMFKRSGSRSNSVERQPPKHDTSSTQRPLMREMRNTSNSNL